MIRMKTRIWKLNVVEHGAQWYSEVTIRLHWLSAQSKVAIPMIIRLKHLILALKWICPVSIIVVLVVVIIVEKMCLIIENINFRSTNRPTIVPRYSAWLLEIYQRCADSLWKESSSWANSHPFQQANLWHRNAKFHGFRGAWCHIDHHFLLIGRFNVGRYAYRAQRRDAWTMPCIWYNRHWNSLLARSHTIRYNVRSNNVCATL